MRLKTFHERFGNVEDGQANVVSLVICCKIHWVVWQLLMVHIHTMANVCINPEDPVVFLWGAALGGHRGQMIVKIALYNLNGSVCYQ
jgi:hypothetical protein